MWRCALLGVVGGVVVVTASVAACTGRTSVQSDPNDTCFFSEMSAECAACTENACRAQLSAYEDVLAPFLACVCVDGSRSPSLEQSATCMAKVVDAGSVFNDLLGCVIANGCSNTCYATTTDDGGTD
jgi:hypothetical protein